MNPRFTAAPVGALADLATEPGPAWPWVPGCVAAGMAAPEIAAAVALAPGITHDAVTTCLRALKASPLNVSLGDGRALVKDARESVKAEAAAGDDSGEGSQDVRINRARWVNPIRAMGGHPMPDTSNKDVEYFVIPSGHTSFAQLLAELREVPADAAPGSLMPRPEFGIEPRKTDRMAWIAKMGRTPDAIPGPVRRIPRPVGQILIGSERYPLVFTGDDVAITITPVEVDRNIWITKAGDYSATGPRMRDITTEAFRRLAHDAPVITTEPQLTNGGHIGLLPRGVMPPGWRNLAPFTDRETAFAKWKRAAGIVESSPGGVAAHVWGAVVGSFFTRFNRRQGHAIDVFGADLHTGKSTLIKTVGAMIGDPEQTARPCDFATAVSATSYAGAIGYGTMPIDESQLFKGDAQESALLVFRLCQSGIRTRSNPDGSGVLASRPFGGMLLLNGNKRFVAAESVDRIYPGLSRRYIPLFVDHDNPVFANAEDADAVADLTNSAYGWLIPLVMESVTNAEFMAWEEDIRRELYDTYPEEDSEVIKLFSFHLAGCRAIDGLFGTALETAARISVRNQASAITHVKANVGELFLTEVRNHIQTNSGKWLTPAEYLAFQTRDLVVSTDVNELRGTEREPVGIRADDDTWFMILGHPVFCRLCAMFGIADPDAVITALDRAELLKVAPSERQRGKKTTVTAMGRVEKRKISANGYHILARATHDDEPSDGQGPTEPADGPESPPEMPGGPATIDPFAAAGKAAPEPADGYKRPDWIPEPLRKDKTGQYSGVVKAFNNLWDRQEKRPNSGFVIAHPYATDDDIPEPVRLVAKNQGTRVHEGTHNYRNVSVPAGTRVTVLDKNAAFLAAIGSLYFPIAGLTPEEGEGDSKQTGIYQITEWPELLANGEPHPWGILKPTLADDDLWVSRPTLDLGREAAAAGLITDPVVIRSYLARPLKANKPARARLEWLYGQLNDARTNALAAHDADGLGFVKAVYSVGVSTMGESGANNRIWRPDIPPMIRALAFANLYRLARKMTGAGLTVAAIKNNDEIHVAGSPDDVFASGVVNKGTALTQIKVKGGYVMGADGQPEPGSEWSNDRG